MRFQDPIWLIFLLIVPIIYYWLKSRPVVSISYSSTEHLGMLEDKRGVVLSRLLVWIRYAILIGMILAMARPQLTSLQTDVLTEGIDIMLVTDVSGSMAAEDLKPNNRLFVAKKTAKEFVSKRTGDHIGLVVFGTKAFTFCPLTLDYGALNAFIDQLGLGMAGDGTAIGMAIATGVNRLKNSSSKSKVLILLTDGENNAGEIDPLSSAELAKEFGIKIYTIGIGKEGGAPIPYIDPRVGKTYHRYPNGALFLTKLDEALLKSISQTTQGQYFRATNSDSLQRIFELINTLETTEKKVKQYHDYYDLFPYFLWGVFCLFMFYFVLKEAVLRVVP